MPLQDLTPQLRTRLNKMERTVGWFVFLAVALLLFGFGYYLYHTADRKGWFLVKARFFTYVNSAAGLNVGDPVYLMGFQVGQITGIEAMPPRNKYNVTIRFVVYQVSQDQVPYYSYIWSEGSVVKLSSDLFGKRTLEVTRGTNGANVFTTFPVESLPLEHAKQLPDPEKWRLAENILDANSNLVFRAYITLLVESNLTRIAALNHEPILAFHTQTGNRSRRAIVSIWNKSLQRFEPFDSKDRAETNAFFLPMAEAPAITDQIQAMVVQVQGALPGILALTNKVNTVMNNAANATSNLNLAIVGLQPVLTNVADITGQLREPGALAVWALGEPSQLQIQTALTNANTLLVNVDTNLSALTVGVGLTLENLANITSNLNVQVQSNTNMLGSVTKIVVDTDDLVQGLKRHWLLRSAFKTNAPAAAAPAAPAPPATRRQSPRSAGS